MKKTTYNIHNEQGAWLMTVRAKNAASAIRQAHKIYTGKVKATAVNQ